MIIRNLVSIFSKTDYIISSDDNNSFSHDNSHTYEINDIIDVATAIDMIISTDNPLLSINDRHADHHELTSSTTQALGNGSHPYRDHDTDDQFSIGIN